MILQNTRVAEFSHHLWYLADNEAGETIGVVVRIDKDTLEPPIDLSERRANKIRRESTATHGVASSEFIDAYEEAWDEYTDMPQKVTAR